MKWLTLIAVLLIAGCTQEITRDTNQTINNQTLTPETITEYEVIDPAVTFTQEDINYLGINCQGSNEEISNCILDWQVENIDYCYPGDPRSDCADPMRFNYMLPGIYPTNEVIREKRDTKIYGICFTYAGIYCSIAKHYGLDCRVMNSITKPSDRTGETFGRTGMSPTEFERLRIKIEEKEYDYDYELMRLIAQETAEHYWAEAYINNEWVVMDASVIVTGFEDTNVRYKSKGDYEITNWSTRDPNPKIKMFNEGKLNDFNAFPNLTRNTQFIDETTQIEETYTGVIDDLGQSGRAGNITDYMAGKGLAPYYESCDKVCNNFFEGQDWCMNVCIEDNDVLPCYESCSSKKFYKICSLTCNEASDMASCYELCSGEKVNTQCFINCMM